MCCLTVQMHILICAYVLSDENGGPPPKTHFSYGSNIHKLEENFTGYGHSLVETGKERTKLVGLLEHEQMLAYSQNLQQAFKKCKHNTYSDFIYI